MADASERAWRALLARDGFATFFLRATPMGEIEGLRLRVRGVYAGGEAHVAGAPGVVVEDFVVTEGATEFSLPRLTTYAVIDLKRAQ